MTKRSIPPLQVGAEPALAAIIENLQVIMGQRGGKVDTLPETASLSDVIAKVNELINKMQ